VLLMATDVQTLLPILDDRDRINSDFEDVLLQHGLGLLRRGETTTLQINVGKRCNQACHHCHVEAGPKRTEIMPFHVAKRVLEILANSPTVHTVDITGGAPELNPNFRFLVEESRRLGGHVIDRCNLTVLYEPGMEDLADFLAENEVEIVASLPCYTAANVDKQRGHGVFEKSIAALRDLNRLGYGLANSPLSLNLVYNPLGPSVPPPQERLEGDYKRELRSRFAIEFHRLYTLTNMPIKRFAAFLEQNGKSAEYMSLLVNHFNPETVSGLMCRSLVSVGWDGNLYDCDFNQMLEIPLGAGPKTLNPLRTSQTNLSARPVIALDAPPTPDRVAGVHCDESWIPIATGVRDFHCLRKRGE
jgi:radical SAM/Cys-rich protein